MQRFNQALRRPPHGDRALDLAISLESLLVDGLGENTYKMGLRAAFLLGGSMEQRLEVRAVVGALYTLRSALIHDGILPSKVKVAAAGKRPAKDVVKDATEICARVLRSILDVGTIPNWYEYELADTGRPITQPERAEPVAALETPPSTDADNTDASGGRRSVS